MLRIGKMLLGLLVLLAALALLVNMVVVLGQRPFVRSYEQLLDETSDKTAYFDCIMVLGAAVQPDGTPSPMLQERLDVGVRLYQLGLAPKLLMSGDNTSDRETYDEVENMKSYAVAAGVPSEDIFCDHAGLCTYDSAYRLYHVFGAQRVLVVSQRYHLYRALFDTASFGIYGIGVPADKTNYPVKLFYHVREAAARVSDCIKVLTRQNATYLSEPVSLQQSGDVTSW